MLTLAINSICVNRMPNPSTRARRSSKLEPTQKESRKWLYRHYSEIIANREMVQINLRLTWTLTQLGFWGLAFEVPRTQVKV